MRISWSRRNKNNYVSLKMTQIPLPIEIRFRSILLAALTGEATLKMSWATEFQIEFQKGEFGYYQLSWSLL